MKKQVKYAFGAVFILILVIFIVWTGRQQRNNIKYEQTGFAMGTVVTSVIYGADGDELCDKVTWEIDSLEQQISWRAEGSEVYNLNHNYVAGEDYSVSYQLAEYISFANALSDKTDGAMDITIRPLASVWGIEDGSTTVPRENDIIESQKSVDYRQVTVTNNYVNINRSGFTIDLGAYGKGIACDRVYSILSASDCKGAVISVGGSILVYGSKPDESAWKVGIRNPRGDENDVMAVINIASSKKCTFISSSGDYEKYFIEDGIRYHHIINPLTGYPADTGIISATVVCDSGIASDGLSTACMLVGLEQSFLLLDEYNAEGMLIDEDKNVYVTDGLKGMVEIKDESYHIAE